MGAYGDTTTGVASAIRSFIKATGSSRVQVFRRHRAAPGPTIVPWTVTAAGSANVLAADVNRTGIKITNASSNRVYIRFDGTIPFAAGAAYAYFLEPWEREDVPEEWVECAVSLCGAAAGGTVYLTPGTDG